MKNENENKDPKKEPLDEEELDDIGGGAKIETEDDIVMVSANKDDLTNPGGFNFRIDVGGRGKK